MKKWRFYLAVYTGYFIKKIIGWLNLSGGNALPGLVALKLCPSILTQLTKALSRLILITGTNGKTTTSRIIAQIMAQNNQPLIHNRIGSNLERGLISALIKPYIANKLKGKWGLFEVDEAAFNVILPKIKVDYIVLTNLFRDQLDRYGEIETTAKKWLKSLQQTKAKLIVNANDPTLAYLGPQLNLAVYYFGLKPTKLKQNKIKHGADTIFCPHCLHPLAFTHIFYSHLGKYHCTDCKFKTPKLDFWVNKLNQRGFTLNTNQSSYTIKKHNWEVYNIYNLLAAFSLANCAKLNPAGLNQIVKNYQPAFGRGEVIKYQDKLVYIYLIKNPTGLNQVISSLVRPKNKLDLMIAINDKLADGRDVSWLWDGNFETLLAQTNKLVISGTRADDMALRSKIAGHKANFVNQNLKKTLKYALNLSAKTIYILPTYTALLELKKILADMGVTSPSWKE